MVSSRGPCPSLRDRALMWLAQREHSRQELAQKLHRWLRLVEQSAPAGTDAEPTEPAALAAEVDALLNALQLDGSLSDQRFVESRVNARISRYGNRRIEQELRRYGVDLEAQLRAQLQLTEADRARRVWNAKFGCPAADDSARVRQMRFLAGRGFSADVIRRVVSCDEDEGSPP